MKRRVRRNLTMAIAIVGIFSAIIMILYYFPSQPQIAIPRFEPESQIIGHIHSLYVDRTTNLMLLGTHEALFRSTDKGNIWTTVKLGNEVPSRDFMAIAPAAVKNSKVLYAVGHGMFVVKSIDGGSAWGVIKQGLTSSDVHAIAIAGNDPNILYIWVVDHGLFRNKNAGASWERINDGPPNSNVLALASVNIPIGMGGIYLYAGTSGGLYRSADCFCGWNKVSNLFDEKTIFSLAVNPSNPNIIFASTSDGFYRSDDGGSQWKNVRKGLEGVTGLALTFDIADSNYIYAVDNVGVVYYSNSLGELWARFR